MLNTINSKKQAFLFALSMGIVLMFFIGLSMISVWTIVQMVATIGPIWTSFIWGAIPGTAAIVRIMHVN